MRELAYTLGVGCLELACHVTHATDFKSSIMQLINGAASNGWFVVLDNIDRLQVILGLLYNILLVLIIMGMDVSL